jgi:membrane protease YdiL (CAAX protease family)
MRGSPAASNSEPRSRHEARRLGLFVALAYGVSWAIWSPLVLASPGNSSAWPYLHLLGAAGPATAAVALAVMEGRRSWAALAGRLAPRRGSAKWLAVAVLGPVGIYGVAVLAQGLVGHTWPRWADLGTSNEYAALGRGPYWAANIAFYGFGEEIGWRGYLLPRLQTRFPALTSALIVSAIWALWHLLLFWFASGMSAMGPPEIVGWLFSMVTGSVILTWLFNSSGGSVTAVALFHGVLDIVFTSPGPAATSSLMGAAVTLWGIAIVFIAGPALVARKAVANEQS